MTKEKTAAFLVDCLKHMPKQKGKIKVAVDTGIAGLTHIANGGEWSRDEARAVADAARAADWPAADADWAVWAVADALAGAAALADEEVGDEDSAAWVAYWAAEAHPDPDAERARQAAVREKLGLNTKGA